MPAWNPGGVLGASYGLEQCLYRICPVLRRLWSAVPVLYGAFNRAFAAGISFGGGVIRMCRLGDVLFFSGIIEHYYDFKGQE